MIRTITYAEALREALDQAMAADPAVFVLGQGVDDPGGIFGSTRGLAEQHGAERCFDTPLAEEALMGIANGAALDGLRPVLVHARVEFALLTFNQLLNHAAKWRGMFGPDQTMPVVVRTIVGRGWGQGAQHAQCLAPLFAHVPGLQVVAPACPADAKGLLLGALRGRDPVLTIEHRQLFGERGEVDEAPRPMELGCAGILRPGEDVTLVAYSQMTLEAARAAQLLAAQGVSAEVVDLRSLVPLDRATIARSVRRTGRLVIIENGWVRCGISAEIAALAAEECLDALRAPVRRIGFPLLAVPSSPVLEEAYYPHAETIARTATELLERPTAASRVSQRTGTQCTGTLRATLASSW